jgi:anti-anti-sigma regulatory factor
MSAFAPGVTVVVADFTPTEFCDSSAVREIPMAHERAAASNVEFRVVAPHRYLMVS